MVIERGIDYIDIDLMWKGEMHDSLVSVPDSQSPPVFTVIIVYWMLMYRREQKILESVYANMFIISAVVNWIDREVE